MTNYGFNYGGPQNAGYNSYTMPSSPVQASNVAIDFVEDNMMVERYATLPGVMTFLVNFNNMTIVIKERDSRGVLKPYRYFNFTEFFPQQVTQNQQSPQTNQGGADLQNQINELKQIVLGMAQQQQPQVSQTPMSTSQNNQRNNKKGGNQT